MNALFRTLHAEQLKLRNTLALWLCVLTPLLVLLFGTLIVWSSPLLSGAKSPGMRWQEMIDIVLTMWGGIMLPLFVTLEAALLAGLEHGNRQWKHLLALPVPRSNHFMAKLITLLALTLLATAVIALLIPFGGWMLMHLAPELGLAGFPPIGHLFKDAISISIAAMLMVALQMVIAIRWRSFIVATATGICATVAAMFIPVNSSVALWFPWSMTKQAISGDPSRVGFALVAAAVGFGLVAVLGSLDFARRESV